MHKEASTKTPRNALGHGTRHLNKLLMFSPLHIHDSKLITKATITNQVHKFVVYAEITT